LPDPSTITGRLYTIKKIDPSANAVTIVGNIDGSTSYSLTSRWQYVTVICTGGNGDTDWNIIANN